MKQLDAISNQAQLNNNTQPIIPPPKPKSFKKIKKRIKTGIQKNEKALSIEKL